jgi:hypothetical protein
MYTDRYGDTYTDPAEILDALCSDMIRSECAYPALVYAAQSGATDYGEALSLARAYLAPLYAFPNVGLSADYCEQAWLIAGSLGSPHVVIFDDSMDNDESPYIILYNLGGDDDHPQTVAGPFASPAEAVAAAREFAASVGLL